MKKFLLLFHAFLFLVLSPSSLLLFSDASLPSSSSSLPSTTPPLSNNGNNNNNDHDENILLVESASSSAAVAAAGKPSPPTRLPSSSSSPSLTLTLFANKKKIRTTVEDDEEEKRRMQKKKKEERVKRIQRNRRFRRNLASGVSERLKSINRDGRVTNKLKSIRTNTGKTVTTLRRNVINRLTRNENNSNKSNSNSENDGGKKEMIPYNGAAENSGVTDNEFSSSSSSLSLPSVFASAATSIKKFSNDVNNNDTKSRVAVFRNKGGGGDNVSSASGVAAAASKTTKNNKKKKNRNYYKQNEMMQQNQNKVPSIYWAVLHNWLYFLSLGFNAINMPFLIRRIIDGTTSSTSPSPKSIALSGNVEAIDKICTFCGIGFLSALSDKYGRKPLLAWSSIGFAMTNLLQASIAYLPPGRAPESVKVGLLYLADFIDGLSSCMAPVCQAYIADVCITGSNTSNNNDNNRLASSLGIFTGISIGGAFIVAFPVGGLLGAKYGPTVPILMAAAFQVLNCLIALFVTPESNTEERRKHNNTIKFSEVNPITGLKQLFFSPSDNNSRSNSSSNLLRIASLTYLCINLARAALDAQFVNYSNIMFGWTQAQSGPVLVLTGLMLAIIPRIVVPVLGLMKSIRYGSFVYAIGLFSAGIVSTSTHFVMAIVVIALGCVCIPANQALLTNLAPPGKAGALLGAVGSLNELTAAIGSSLYATLVATFATTTTNNNNKSRVSELLLKYLPSNIPGMHLLFGSFVCAIGWMISVYGLNKHKHHPALSFSSATTTTVNGTAEMSQ